MIGQISRDEVRSFIEDKLCAHFGVTGKEADDAQLFQATAMVLREIMSRLQTAEDPRRETKEIHYMSMEFLMGRSLMKNAFNLGIAEAVTGALEDLGRNASDIFEEEPDAGLGNGGLGRLAACYMDSMATLGLEATGYSLCYELGIFRQKFVDGKQTEVADNWRDAMEGWLIPRYDDQVEVRFGGQISPHWDNYGRYHAEHTGYTAVIAVPRDMLIAGYGGGVNTLRLWEAHSTNSLDMYLFSEGEYVKSLEQRTMTEVITKVLYPADDHTEGKTLRLKQQYFFVSASAQDIVRRHIEKWGDIRSFAEHHTIQINDTHPTLIIPELMRLFMDEYGLGWDESWEIVKRSVAYTNHTVMSEALEKWPQNLIQQLLPRIWEILCEINNRWVNYLVGVFGEDERVGRNMIIRDGQVFMANLDLAACYKVNGVSRLHGDILKRDLFRDVCSLRPERFTHVTNGIDHRRWLAQINPGLHGLICELLGGDEYLLQPTRLEELMRFAGDSEVRRRVLEIKADNKRRFAAFAARNDGFALNTDAVMDVQIKRLHEYKRQLLCAMRIAALQMQLHDDPNCDFVPRCFVFGAKAAAGYKTAKRIIELLLSMQADINNDPLCKDKLQIYFVENYRVSAAEAIMPAAQVSEQISTAGKEASGTGCMKLMMNGAVTIGTLDGANVEMYERLGDENLFLFGLRTEEIDEVRSRGYNPVDIFNADSELQRVLSRFRTGFADGKSYPDLVSGLLYGGDPYMLIADYRSYADCQTALYDRIRSSEELARLAIVNTAQSGYFAADRAIEEYARNIWQVR